MDDRMRIGSAVVGGYILGRTRKGRAGLRLAMWLSDSDYRPTELVRTGATRVTQSAEATKLLEQLRGPLMVAAQRAAQATVEAQLGRLTEGIQRRTESLTRAIDPATKAADETTETVTRPVSKAAGSLTKKAKLEQDVQGEEGEEVGRYNEAAEPVEKHEEGEEGGEQEDADQYDEAQADEKGRSAA